MPGLEAQTLNASFYYCYTCFFDLTHADTPEQKKKFAENPLEYQNYCKQIEDELNQRFKFILNKTPEAEGAIKVCEYE